MRPESRSPSALASSSTTSGSAQSHANREGRGSARSAPEGTVIRLGGVRRPRDALRSAFGVVEFARVCCEAQCLTSYNYMKRYLGPDPPSRGVHRGPTTSVALQSTQLGALTRR